MPRELSPEMTAAKEAQVFCNYFTFEVTLPLKAGESEPVRILVSTAEKESGGESYEPDVRAMADIQIAEGGSADGVDFSLVNLEDDYGPTLSDPARNLYPAPAVVRELVKLEDGTFEPVELVTGYARFGEVNNSTAKVTVISDLSRRSLTVIDVVTQRCKHVYKGPGCDSPDPSPTCSRIFHDAVDGCAAKAPAPVLIGATNNQPSFGGVPTLEPNAAAAASGGEVSNSFEPASSSGGDVRGLGANRALLMDLML